MEQENGRRLNKMNNSVIIMICLLICCIDFIMYKLLSKYLKDQFYAYILSSIFFAIAAFITIKFLVMS